MSDLQDMDTSDLEGMDEEDTDSQPSDNEPVTGDTGQTEPAAAAAPAPNGESVKTDKRFVSTEMTACDTHKTSDPSSSSKGKISDDTGSGTDQNKLGAKANKNTKHYLDGKLEKPEQDIRRISKEQSEKANDQNILASSLNKDAGHLDNRQHHQQIDNIASANKMTIQMRDTVLKDAPDKNYPDSKRVKLDNHQSESSPNKHAPKRANVIQESDSNASFQSLHYGTEQENVVFAGEIEELVIEDEQTELTSLEIPASARGSISIKETGGGIKVLDHNEERDIVRARSYSDSVAAAYFDTAFGSLSKPDDQPAGAYQLAERKDIMFHVGYEELKTEMISDIDFKPGTSEQVTNLDEDMEVDEDLEVDKIIGASKTDQFPYDEVDARLPSPFTDDPNNFNPCKRESKVKWDDNIFLIIADKDDNILIDEPILSNNWKEDEELFEWHMKHEPAISQSWKEEIIQRNLRDLPDDASLEVNPPSLRMVSDDFCSDLITESKSSDVTEGLISDFSYSLSDRILVDVLETLSSTFSQISGKERTSNIGDDITSGTENSFKIDESQLDSSSKVPEIYSCDSYSDFCRELEASDSGYKASIGVSFADNDDSVSFDDKPDEFPKIEICEPTDFDKVSPDDFENFIQVRLKKDDNLTKELNEIQAETNSSEFEAEQVQVDDSELRNVIADANVVDVLEAESLSSLEYHQGMVLNTGLSEDQEYHEIMAALANEEYRMDEQGFIAGTAQDYGLVPGSDIEEGAASLEYCDWAISEDDCKWTASYCMISAACWRLGLLIGRPCLALVIFIILCALRFFLTCLKLYFNP